MKLVEKDHRRKTLGRRGQAMLEFALLIPFLIVLIGATISFGLFFFQANVLQQAVDVAAQEIARMPFEPDQELGLGRIDKCDLTDPACDDTRFKQEIYDEQYLVIDDAEWGSSTSFNGNFQAFADQLPLLNRLLVPVMVRDNAMLRYPGTLVENEDGEQTILIPIVEYQPVASAGGKRLAGELIVEWVAPVEEIRVDHDGDDGTTLEGPFKLTYDAAPTLPSFEPGMVALRINYPAQSTTLINRIDVTDPVQNPDGNRGGILVIAGDTDVTAFDATCYTISAPTPRISQGTGLPGSNPHAGEFGLGELEAFQTVLRPYRKVMTFQAIYRREVFE